MANWAKLTKLDDIVVYVNLSTACWVTSQVIGQETVTSIVFPGDEDSGIRVKESIDIVARMIRND